MEKLNSKKKWYMHIMEYYLAFKRQEILTCAAA